MLNWSIGVFMNFIASFISIMVLRMFWKIYRRTPNISTLLIISYNFCLFSWTLIQGTSFLIPSLPLHYIGLFPVLFAVQILLFFVEYNIKESLSPLTLIFCTIMMFGSLINSLPLNVAFKINFDPFGKVFYTWSGNLAIFGTISMIISFFQHNLRGKSKPNLLQRRMFR